MGLVQMFKRSKVQRQSRTGIPGILDKMDGNELALLPGIMLTGLFKYLVQAHSLEAN